MPAADDGNGEIVFLRLLLLLSRQSLLIEPRSHTTELSHHLLLLQRAFGIAIAHAQLVELALAGTTGVDFALADAGHGGIVRGNGNRARGRKEAIHYSF